MSSLYRQPLALYDSSVRELLLAPATFKLGSVLALPLNESPPFPLTAIPMPTCSLSSLGQMTLLPSAFSQGTVSPVPLLPSSAQILRAQSAQKVLSATAPCGPEGSDWHRGMQLPFLNMGQKPCGLHQAIFLAAKFC